MPTSSEEREFERMFEEMTKRADAGGLSDVLRTMANELPGSEKIGSGFRLVLPYSSPRRAQYDQED